MSVASSLPCPRGHDRALAIRTPRRVPHQRPTNTDARADVPRDVGVRRLTHAIARGDEQAFALLYNDWFEPAYAMARDLTRRDESFCLDVVQDAMLKAARSMKPISTEEHLNAWMRRVVHTAALDHLRAERRRRARELARAGDAPEGAQPLDERIQWLRTELAKLPATDRSLLRLKFAQSTTLAEAGASEGITGASAHGRIRRAIARLAEAARRNER